MNRESHSRSRRDGLIDLRRSESVPLSNIELKYFKHVIMRNYGIADVSIHITLSQLGRFELAGFAKLRVSDETRFEDTWPKASRF